MKEEGAEELREHQRDGGHWERVVSQKPGRKGGESGEQVWSRAGDWFRVCWGRNACRVFREQCGWWVTIDASVVGGVSVRPVTWGLDCGWKYSVAQCPWRSATLFCVPWRGRTVASGVLGAGEGTWLVPSS